MMTYIQSDPNLAKYQWIGKIEKDESSFRVLPFLDYSKALGKIEKDKNGNYAVACLSASFFLLHLFNSGDDVFYVRNLRIFWVHFNELIKILKRFIKIAFVEVSIS